MDLLAFKVVIEPDFFFDSDKEAWQSYYPAWVHLGAATGGDTRAEAAANIVEVLGMLVEEINEGKIERLIEPYVPDGEHTKPAIENEPAVIHLDCASSHLEEITAQGGLPVESDDAANPGDIYRIVYVPISVTPGRSSATPAALFATTDSPELSEGLPVH